MSPLPHSQAAEPAGRGAAERRRRHLGLALALAGSALLLLGLLTGSQGLHVSAWLSDLRSDDAALLLGEIRGPRSLGALLVGALLGLSGAIAQSLFRNPLADPYLLGSASGASLGVALVLAAATLAGQGLSLSTAHVLAQAGLAAAAFIGAMGGVLLTLLISRGTHHPTRLLLGGVVVGVVLGSVGDLVATLAPEALRGRQIFLLGSTGYLGWTSVYLLAAALVLVLGASARLARFLDAMTLGEETAASLGLNPPRLRAVMVTLLALGTGTAVSQAGLIAFVGLVAPHLVRRCAPGPNRYLLLASAGAGGVLLLAADILARTAVAPQELPVGIVTAALGGGYLLWLLYRHRLPW